MDVNCWVYWYIGMDWISRRWRVGDGDDAVSKASRTVKRVGKHPAKWNPRSTYEPKGLKPSRVSVVLNRSGK